MRKYKYYAIIQDEKVTIIGRPQNTALTAFKTLEEINYPVSDQTNVWGVIKCADNNPQSHVRPADKGYFVAFEKNGHMGGVMSEKMSDIDSAMKEYYRFVRQYLSNEVIFSGILLCNGNDMHDRIDNLT